MRAKKGFTLIELLIAVVLISISMLAMAKGVMMSMRANLENDMRNTAVRLTNQTAETLLSLQWSRVGSVLQVDPELAATAPGAPHRRIDGNASQDAKGFPRLGQIIKNFQFDYQIEWTVDDLTDNSKRIVITVRYTLRDGRVLINTAAIYRQIQV